MQRGIDSFFKRIGPAASKPKETESPAPKKRKALVISSDEDEIPESPQINKAKKDVKKSRIETKPEKTPEKTPAGKIGRKPALSKLKKSPKDLKPIDPTALFGGETLRIAAKKPEKPKDATTLELEDDDINQSLLEIDVVNTSVVSKAKPLEAEKADKKTPQKHAEDKPVEKSVRKTNLEVELDKITPPSAKKLKKTNGVDVADESTTTPKAVKKEKTTPRPKKEHAELDKKPKKEKNTPNGKKANDELDSSVLTDEERHERKRMTAILYQKYKNRSSCLNHGCKEVPQGKPNCLSGLTFLVTGVLESLERDEAGSIIKDYGGKVMSTVGKRLNYLIVGEEAGPKKLAQAEEMGIKVLSEDDFFDLIRERSGEKPANTATANGHVKKEENIKAEPTKKTTTPNKYKVKEEDKEKVQVKLEKPSPAKKTKLETPEKIRPVKVKAEEQLAFVREPKQEISEDLMAWVEKYKPTSVKDIIGQQGAASNVTKLTNWLSKWYTNHDGKKKLQKPNPWAKNDDGSYFKAALLSGPPGIGKTTTATLVCKELGFDVVEFNASDTRSKKLLKEEVAELLSNKSLYGYFHGNAQAVTKKHILIMDEVDGMAGNEDRGGIQELIGLIKDSSVPVICMCNDRNHQKMRSLVNYCYDLRFNKPRLEQIKARIKSICFKEKIQMDSGKIEEIIAATNNDIRQSINHISLLSAGKELNLKSDSANSDNKTATKDLKLGPWDVVRKVFSTEEHKNMSFYDKCDLFFHDYSLAPLFVQQNYLIVTPAGSKSEIMQKVARTADALSLGDLVDKRIRSNSAWTLLPTQAIFSSVLPGAYMSGHFTGQINFPGWLGKNSRATKRSRLAQEIHDHTRLRTSGSRLSIRLDYAPFLLDKIVRPLREHGLDGVEESLAVMKEYHLLREDIDSLMELSHWPGKKGAMDAVDGKVKAALTRAYNKEVLAYTYSAAAGVKKKKAEASDDAGELLGLEGEDGGDDAVAAASDDSDADNLENDGLIKAKKKSTAASAKASTSKAASGSKKAAGTAPKTKPKK